MNPRVGARERLARLRGAFLQIRAGGRTPSERAYRSAMLDRIARTLQTALATGLLPGGGASLAVAARTLAREESTCTPTERAVFRAAQAALLEPLRTLLANAGLDPAPLVSRTLASAPDVVYDVEAGRWVDPWCTGLVDPLGVLEAAVETSWSLARAFLSIGACVHRTWPASSAEP